MVIGIGISFCVQANKVNISRKTNCRDHRMSQEC